MPNTEIHRQIDMFTGELVDTRTRRQKEQDKEREQPKQAEMFSQKEIAQFGVNPRPLLPISPTTKLGLIFEDPRTEEEKEQDRQREAEARTYQLFSEPLEDKQAEWAAQGAIAPDATTLALVPCGIVAVILYERTAPAVMSRIRS